MSKWWPIAQGFVNLDLVHKVVYKEGKIIFDFDRQFTSVKFDNVESQRQYWTELTKRLVSDKE